MIAAPLRCWLLSRTLTVPMAALFLTGCQSWILKPDTVDMAGSVGPIYMQQAVQNLARFADDPDSMPSQIDINTGTIGLTSGITPSLTVPFGNTVVRGAANSITTVTDPYRSLSLGGSITRSGQWSVAAVSDPIRIKNLSALYRYANSGDVEQLITEYSMPVKIESGKFVVDPAYLVSPLCVFCVKAPGDAGTDDSVPRNFKPGADNLNPMLKFDGRLIEKSQPASGGMNLGRYGKSELWISTTNSTNHRLSDFVLFLLPLTLVSATPATKAP